MGIAETAEIAEAGEPGSRGIRRRPQPDAVRASGAAVVSPRYLRDLCDLGDLGAPAVTQDLLRGAGV